MKEYLADQIGAAIRAATIREVDHGPDWLHTRLGVRDGGFPFTVDVVADLNETPLAIVYMLPGSGLNFEANFLRPRDHNLAHFLRSHRRLIVGINAREDRLDPGVEDIALAGWGLAKRKRDILGIIAMVNQRLEMPYELLGHSAGGVEALDCAADRACRPDRVMVIDTTGPYDPVVEPALARRATATAAACVDLIAGAHEDHPRYTIDLGLKALIGAAVDDPTGMSFAVPRPDGSPATNASAAHYALIRTAELPGLLNWIYERGFSAGTHVFGATPAGDRFSLDHTPLSVWAEAVAALGSGLLVTARLRDLAAVWGGDRATYSIDWAAIDAEVNWVNMALGRGDHPGGARLIQDGGNDTVRFSVVSGYAHGDPAWGRNADRDVWPLLIRQEDPRASAWSV